MPSNPVVRVGEATVARTTVEHWMSVMAGGRATATLSKRTDRALLQQAVDFLISSGWLIGEADDQGLAISEAEVKHRVKRLERASFPGGEAELNDYLRATSQTRADLELLAKAELAASKLRQMSENRAADISQIRTVRYYEQHKQHFVVPERREVYITNRKSGREGYRVRREVESGRAPPHLLQRELAEGPGQRTDGPLERAIHAARVNVVTGPVKQRVDYFVFEVTRIVPATYQPLSEVGVSIRRQLAKEERLRALAAFVETWRSRWIAKTDCYPGYVVQKCSNYKGPRTPEDPRALD